MLETIQSKNDQRNGFEVVSRIAESKLIGKAVKPRGKKCCRSEFHITDKVLLSTKDEYNTTVFVEGFEIMSKGGYIHLVPHYNLSQWTFA